jgi:hypothetical protein
LDTRYRIGIDTGLTGSRTSDIRLKTQISWKLANTSNFNSGTGIAALFRCGSRKEKLCRTCSYRLNYVKLNTGTGNRFIILRPKPQQEKLSDTGSLTLLLSLTICVAIYRCSSNSRSGSVQPEWYPGVCSSYSTRHIHPFRVSWSQVKELQSSNL